MHTILLYIAILSILFIGNYRSYTGFVSLIILYGERERRAFGGVLAAISLVTGLVASALFNRTLNEEDVFS